MNKTYWYGLLTRPPMIGLCPKDGLIEYLCEDGMAPSGRHYWAIACYNRKLDPVEAKNNQLEELSYDWK